MIGTPLAEPLAARVAQLGQHLAYLGPATADEGGLALDPAGVVTLVTHTGERLTAPGPADLGDVEQLWTRYRACPLFAPAGVVWYETRPSIATVMAHITRGGSRVVLEGHLTFPGISPLFRLFTVERVTRLIGERFIDPAFRIAFYLSSQGPLPPDDRLVRRRLAEQLVAWLDAAPPDGADLPGTIDNLFTVALAPRPDLIDDVERKRPL